MQIDKLSMSGFTKLSFSNIHRLDISVDNDTQIIIGTNGSGKSSILGELLPTAPVKTFFTKDGFKELHLNHCGNKYELTYTREYGHLFKKNGKNLNGSNIRNIQLELIKKHLGVDSNVAEILKCSLDIVGMRPSNRQALLLDLNPTDISIFMTEKKKVHKNVVALKNNLTMLHDRERQLVSQILSKSELEKTQQAVNVLKNEEQSLLINLTKVNSIIESLGAIPADPRSTCDLSVGYIKGIVKGILKESSIYDGLNKANSKQTSLILPTKIKLKQQQVDDMTNVLSEIASDINKYESELTEASNTDDYGKRISSLFTELGKIGNCTSPAIPKDQIDSIRQAVTQITDEATKITYLDYTRIYSRDELTTLLRNHDVNTSELRSLGNSCTEINRQIANLHPQIIKYELADDCSKDNCELYTTYNNRIQLLKEEYRKLNDQLDRNMDKLEKLNVDYNLESEEIIVQKSIWKHIAKISDILNSHPILLIFYSTDNLPEALSKSISATCQQYNSFIDHSVNTHHKEVIEEEIKELQQAQKASEDTNKVSADFIKKELDRLYTNRKKNTISYTKEMLKLEHYNSELQLVNQYLRNLEHLRTLQKELNEHQQVIEVISHHDYLVRVSKILDSQLSEVRADLVSGETLLREQLSLMDRLDKEIKGNIKQLKIQHTNASNVEKALKELAHIHTKTFLNNVIAMTCHFISEIMTYPLVIKPITKDVISFLFPMVVSDTIPIKDINEGSKGQKAIINLAFNLALIIELKLTEYPIFVDEVDKELDSMHRYRLVELFDRLVERKVISQLFLVHHHPELSEAINGDTIMLDGTNIDIPKTVNQNVTIEYKK